MASSEFQNADSYAQNVKNRKVKATKIIVKEFKAKGIDDLFLLRENYMMDLREIFEVYPVCRCLLTKITSEISPKAMFERGLEEQAMAIGATNSDSGLFSKLSLQFCRAFEGKLQIFIRDVIRSVWIYGFVVVKYTEHDGSSAGDDENNHSVCCYPEAVGDDEYFVFRDVSGQFYARGLQGEKYQVYFMDKPDVNGDVRSAMSHLYSNARYLEHMKLCQMISARNAAPSVLVTSRRPGPEEEEKRLQSEFEKKENKVTGYAVEALLRARPSSASDSSERNTFKIPKLDVNFEREYVDASNNCERLIEELDHARREACELRWLQQCDLLTNFKEGFHKNSRFTGIDDFIRDKLVYKLDDGADNRILDGHRLDVKLLNIDSAKEEFHHHVKNVLLGTVSFSERGSALDNNVKQRTSESAQRTVDACVCYWQDFLLNTVLHNWINVTGIPLSPRLRTRKEDINALIPLFPFITADRQAKILSEVLNVPVADILTTSVQCTI